MLLATSTSPKNFSVNVISLEGNITDVTVNADFTIEKIKIIVIKHFYGNDIAKTSSQFRLIHSSKFKQLVDTNSVNDEEINEHDELMLMRIRPVRKENLSEDTLKGPSEEAIMQATNDLPICNPHQHISSAYCSVDFQNEIRKILITLVKASAKILMYSSNIEKFYEILKDKLEAKCKPTIDPNTVKVLMEMGYSHKRVIKALCLRKSNISEALEWLIEHQDDSDNDDDLHFLIEKDNDKVVAGSSLSNSTRRRSLKEMCIELFKAVVQPPVTLFMGIDKFENEDLIRWGWPEDVWFHVDKYSSAHVYLRLNFGQTIDDIPSAVLEDAAQLVKANSIEGNKMNDIDVVYTMWSNLKKTQGMDVGQVGFHKDKEVRKIHVAKRISTIVNRLNKTKKVEQVNFRAEREKRDRIEREDKKKLLREQKEKEKAEEKRLKEEAEMRSYNSLFDTCNMTSNTENTGYDSDDFM
nr:PREDICTED: ubiquitin-associated domain-containing protein 1-like isoform X3 [Megachile rotundata]